jgi:sulfotransferase family protein
MAVRITPNHKLPVRVVNHMISGLRWLGLKTRPFDADRMMTWARRMTGLKDFGDPSFEEPLRLLVQDLNGDRDLHEAGRLFHWYFLSTFLRNRLRLVEAWKRQPEALQQDVKPPLVILGLPRTATTRLFNVLAGDPNLRTLTFWEASRPVKARGEDMLPFNPRRLNARLSLGAVNYLMPHFKSIHELLLEGPEECIHLLANSFVSWIFPVEYNSPHYTKWFDDVDHTLAYQEFKGQLQLLQIQKPTGRWLLKSPHHLFGVEALLKVFPDAMIIQTHRDPIKVVPSCCSLAQATRSIASAGLDLHELGDQIHEQLALGLERTTTFRPSIPDGQVIDIQFQEIVEDVMGVAQRIYDAFGLDMDPEVEAAMRCELHKETHNKHGRHHYSAAQFGLSDDVITQRFSGYTKAFNVAVES